mmetsp:Transcript_27796/g.67635  ORF Transcript_27796/g.67635 Transcript_27796/m.67635 type:complete len:314 (-) Transcript_27796:1614-2555(-)
MRALDQNVRQRQSLATRVGEKSQRTNSAPTSWEHTSDEAFESTISGSNVPMYNPLHFSDETNGKPGSPPASHSASYDKTDDMMFRSPVGMEGIHSTGDKLNTHSLALNAVPDSSYQAYLKGQSFKKKKGSFVDGICFAKFCAFFSVVAIMFFIFVGIIIDVQPMYLQGILIKHEQYNENQKMQTFYDLTQAERLDTARHAYQAAFFYFLTVCACLAYAYNFNFYFNSRMGQYHDVPDADTTNGNFGTASSKGGLPMFNSHTMQAYQYDDSIGSRVWNMATLTTNRVRMRIASNWPSYGDKRRTRRRQTGAKDV